MKFQGQQHQKSGSSIVYWLHLPEHDDIFTEGYVGITKERAVRRWQSYKNQTKKLHKQYAVRRAIAKHHDKIICEVVVVAESRDYCESIEAKLRPSNNIGWNIAKGGIPVDTKLGGFATQRKYLIDLIQDKEKSCERWWNQQMVLLNKQAKAKAAEAKKIARQLQIKANRLNKEPNTNSSTKSLGVSLFKGNRYKAAIGISPKVIHLGYYKTIDDASTAYSRAVLLREDLLSGHLTMQEFREKVKPVRKYTRW
jgi:hypothetical protein